MRRGDTLEQIAVRTYGDARAVRDILDANGHLGDPRRLCRIGDIAGEECGQATLGIDRRDKCLAVVFVRVEDGDGRTFLRLQGGILGRTDDMIHLRGNNVYPSALEDVIRRFPGVAEYRIEVDASETLAVLRIEVEPQQPGDGSALAEGISHAIRDALLFRAEVRIVPPGTLPRYEMKAQRISRKGAKPQREDKGDRQ